MAELVYRAAETHRILQKLFELLCTILKGAHHQLFGGICLFKIGRGREKGREGVREGGREREREGGREGNGEGGGEREGGEGGKEHPVLLFLTNTSACKGVHDRGLQHST